jgi:hypothetical protein
MDNLVRLQSSNLRFQGLLAAATPGSPLVRDLSFEKPDSFAAEAFKRLRPGQAHMNLLQSIVELKDLRQTVTGIVNLRNAFKSVAHLRRGAGGSYLGYEFGIKPMISDLKDLFNAQSKVQRKLDQLARDNGKSVRRNGVIHSEQNVTDQAFSSWSFNIVPALIGPAKPVYTRTRSRRVWATMRFRYWIPDLGSPQWKRRAIQEMYGLRPNLSLLYELTPWSWLIDWFSNTGDVISNMTENSAENLVTEYNTVQCHSHQFDHFMVTGTTKTSATGVAGFSVSTKTGWESKQRVLGSPFGLGLADTPLSVRQLAILGALGLTKT